MYSHSCSFVIEPLFSQFLSLLVRGLRWHYTVVDPQGTLIMNCHSWPLKASVGSAATIFSYRADRLIYLGEMN